MLKIKRVFGISSEATHYEYRRILKGEYGDIQYKTFIIRSAASMGRIYKLTNNMMFSSRTKEVNFRTYNRLFPHTY